MVVKEMTLDEKIIDASRNRHDGTESDESAGDPFQWRRRIRSRQFRDWAFPRSRCPTRPTACEAAARMAATRPRCPRTLPARRRWDLEGAYDYGALIGRELRAQGYNMSLGGGMNLTREPRNGRTFEYMGEDPVLAGKMVGSVMKGLQAQHVLGDIKHYALNDQESGRNAVNMNIDERAARESDLLAFEIGLQESDAAAVMCSYNRLGGDYACENKYLLTDVLKKDWKFKGFVLSDWQATHSTAKSSSAGLDHEEPGWIFYGDDLKKAVESGKVPQAELDDHVHRILRSMFATGVVDDPPQKSVVDVDGRIRSGADNRRASHRSAEERWRAASAGCREKFTASQ